MNAKRRRAHQKLAALPGVRSVRRPVAAGLDRKFDLFYVRTGRKSAHPLVVVPGGPGAASIALYRGFRRRAAGAGLDVIMVEHRGVGMSRHDDKGTDLPPEALTIEQVVDDVAAVLDDAHVDKAILYGASYGTYIAAGVGVRHPQRVAGMILDSPVLSAADVDVVRAAIRGVLWDGTEPETAGLAPKVRRLVGNGVLTPAAGQLAAAVYGFGGPALLDRQLNLLLRGRRGLWTLMDRLARVVIARKAPYRNEPDLVAEMPRFAWPTVIVSGGRDLTTPPAVADRITSLIPGAVLVRLPTAGHSVLDSRERAALQIAKSASDNRIDGLPTQAAQLDALPSGPALRVMVAVIGAAAALESVLPRFVQRVAATSS